MEQGCHAVNQKTSLTFYAYKSTMRMTPALLSQMGNPSHLQFLYDKQCKLFFIRPAEPDDRDAVCVADFAKGLTLRRKRFLGLVYRIAGWHTGLSYDVPGTYMREDNAFRFDLKRYDIVWRGKKIFVLV